MPYLRHLDSVIHQGGQDTGPIVGTITTTLVTPRWLRFRPAHVLVTITGLDEVEAWVRGARDGGADVRRPPRPGGHVPGESTHRRGGGAAAACAGYPPVTGAPASPVRGRWDARSQQGQR